MHQMIFQEGFTCPPAVVSVSQICTMKLPRARAQALSLQASVLPGRYL